MNNEHKSTSNGLDITLMKKLLDDNFYFDFLKEGVLNSYRAFLISSNLHDELLNVTKISNYLIDVLNVIKDSVEDGSLKLNDKENANYHYLLDNVSINLFIEKYKDKFFNSNLNGMMVKVPCNYFIDFLTLTNDSYDDFFDDKIKKHKEFEKEDFLYLFINFIKREIHKKYIFEDKYKRRIDEIVNYERLDVEYLYYSNPNAVRYENLDQLKLTDELKNEVLKDMPEKLDSVKKAIYIYIKLCKILTYDPEFYALGQGLNGVEKHRGIRNIESITPVNNEAICYEFCAIYAKLIKELGFDYEIEGDSLGMLLGLHQYLNVLLGKYFVSVDSVTSVLYGDMTRAKLNQPLEGIKCLNKNNKSRKEFNLMVTEVYSIIVNQENKKQRDHSAFTFADLNLKGYSFEDKIRLLLKKANEFNLKTIDFMGYVKQLMGVLFGQEERENKVKFSIVSDKKRSKEGKDATVTGIFTIIENQKKCYFLYNDDEKLLIPLSESDLNEMFNEGKLRYIDKQNTIIPGIASEGRIV